MDSKFEKYIEGLKKPTRKTKASLIHLLEKSEKSYKVQADKLENEKQKNRLLGKLKLISGHLEVLKNLSEDDIIKFALSTESKIMDIASNRRMPSDIRIKARIASRKPLSIRLEKIKKELINADESESKGKTQDEGPKTLDKFALNKQIGKMRNVIKQAKVHIIHKLTRNITILRESKGPDKKIEKRKRKASRLIKKVKYLMAVDEDDVSKFALCNTQDLNKISTDIKMPMRTQAMATIAVYKLVTDSVEIFRKAFPDWHKTVPELLKMEKKKKHNLAVEVKENVKTLSAGPNKKSKIASGKDKLKSHNREEESFESDQGEESDQEEDIDQEEESDQEEASDQEEESDQDNESDGEGRKENTKNEHNKDEEMLGLSENGSNNEAKKDSVSGSSKRLSKKVRNSLHNKVSPSLMSKRKKPQSKCNNKKKTNIIDVKSNVHDLNNRSTKLSKNNSNSVSKSVDSVDKEISIFENKSFNNIQSVNTRKNLNKRKPERNEFIQTKKRCKDLALNKKEELIVNSETNKKRSIINKKENSKEISKPRANESTGPTKVVDPFFMTTTNEEYITSQVPVANENAQSSWKDGKEYSKTRFNKFNKFENKNKWNMRSNGNWKQNNFNNRENQHFKKPYKNRFEKIPNAAGKFMNTQGNRKERRKALNQPPQEEKVEKLHPSWEAKRKLTAITSFQGKKVTFD